MIPEAADHWIRKNREEGLEMRDQPGPIFGFFPSYELPLHPNAIGEGE